MKMKQTRSLGAAAVLALLIMSISFVGRDAGAAAAKLPDNWLTDWDKAKTEAKSSGKPILAVLSAEWCGPCQMMIREVYPKENVKAVLKDYVAVYIDGDKHPDLAQKFQIDGYPTFVIMSSEAVEEDRFVGARPEETFIDVLKSHGANQARLKEIKTGLEKSPEDAKLWAELGQIMEKKDRMEEAVAAYEKAVFYDPKDETGVADDLYLLKALPTTEDGFEEASKKLAAFEGKFPKSNLLDKVILIRAFIAADMEEFARSKALLKEGIARFPESQFADRMKETLKEIEAASAQ